MARNIAARHCLDPLVLAAGFALMSNHSAGCAQPLDAAAKQKFHKNVAALIQVNNFTKIAKINFSNNFNIRTGRRVFRRRRLTLAWRQMKIVAVTASDFRADFHSR